MLCSWKRVFEEHQEMWLGVLATSEQTGGAFIRWLVGEPNYSERFGEAFFKKTARSFLQRHRETARKQERRPSWEWQHVDADISRLFAGIVPWYGASDNFRRCPGVGKSPHAVSYQAYTSSSCQIAQNALSKIIKTNKSGLFKNTHWQIGKIDISYV